MKKIKLILTFCVLILIFYLFWVYFFLLGHFIHETGHMLFGTLGSLLNGRYASFTFSLVKKYLYAVIYDSIVITANPHVPINPESFGLSLWPASPSKTNNRKGSRGIQTV